MKEPEQIGSCNQVTSFKCAIMLPFFCSADEHLVMVLNPGTPLFADHGNRNHIVWKVVVVAAALLLMVAVRAGRPGMTAQLYGARPWTAIAKAGKTLGGTQPLAQSRTTPNSMPLHMHIPQTGLHHAGHQHQGLAASGILVDSNAPFPDSLLPSLSLVTVGLVAMVSALQTGQQGKDSRSPAITDVVSCHSKALHALMSTSGAISPPTPSAANPIPWPALIQVLAIQFAESFSTNLILPLLPFMVRGYFPTMSDASVGYYSGALVSVFYLGQLLSSSFWGVLSDHTGRRPALLWGLAGLILSLVALAVSPSFVWAMGARFAMGLLNGNTAVGKACALLWKLLCGGEGQGTDQR